MMQLEIDGHAKYQDYQVFEDSHQTAYIHPEAYIHKKEYNSQYEWSI